MQRRDIVTSSSFVVYLVQNIILDTQISHCSSLSAARTLLLATSVTHRFCRPELITFCFAARKHSMTGWVCFRPISVLWNCDWTFLIVEELVEYLSNNWVVHSCCQYIPVTVFGQNLDGNTIMTTILLDYTDYVNDSVILISFSSCAVHRDAFNRTALTAMISYSWFLITKWKWFGLLC